MKAKLSLGSCPYGQACPQVGANDYDYDTRAQVECSAYANQLRRCFAAAFPDQELLVKVVTLACPHDFGTYYEVFGIIDDSNKLANEQLAWFDGNSPEFWDSEALDELALKGDYF